MITDDGFEEDLRDRFDDALHGVQPSPDLYGRAQARVRRRGAARLAAGIAAVTLVLAAGVVAVTAAGPSSERVQVDPVASPPSDQPTDAPSHDPRDEASVEPGDAPSDEASDEPTQTPSTEPEASESPTVEGDPYSGPPIIAGAAMAVIGVDADDALNVRAAPGTNHDVVATLEPLTEGFTATGEGRSLDGGIWVEVDTGAVTGWVHAAFIAHTGATEDITSQVIEEHGSRPGAETLGGLAEIVAGHVATQDPPSRVVVSDGPHVGDLGEVTVDVVGFGDDAVRAARLVVIATHEGGRFTLRSVESTTYCGRGVTDDEWCV